MKVFCQDCAWRDIGVTIYDDNKCSNPYNMKQFVTRNRAYMKICSDVNKDGQCSRYKRQWYKFWRPKTPDKIIRTKAIDPGGIMGA